MGAHLDSWDLGVGAIDDGFGVASVLAAAKAILDAGVKPRRTLRFVLFTGEEQGLLGSRAYVRAHAAELQDFVGALVLDWGHGRITKLPVAGHEELVPVLEPLTRLLVDVQKVEVSQGYLFATDAYAFTLAGLPGIAPFQDSPDYASLGHSAADTFDQVDPEVLVRNSAILALSSFWMANYPVRVSERWSPEKTAQVLTKDGERTVLETLRLWPFPRHK